MGVLYRGISYTWAVVLLQNFCTRTGKAELFEMVSNVQEGKKEERAMITGIYTIRDIRCKQCLELLGWKYVGSGVQG